MQLDPTARFSDRADAYARGRPGYPTALVSLLVHDLDLPTGAVVADLGSGTGRSAEPFLDAGLAVVGVEPNQAMRAEGLRQLGRFPAFSSVDGTAEATGLAESSVDLVIAAQAFHWFDAAAARVEALRILRPPARAAVLWNDRSETGTDFAEGYERLLLTYGTDYREIHGRHRDERRIEEFFGPAGWRLAVLSNPTALDFDTLSARLQSASYTPPAGSPAHAAMMAALADLFAATQVDGRVMMDHETRVYYGSLAP